MPTKVKDAKRCSCHKAQKPEAEAYTRSLETVIAIQADQLDMMRRRLNEHAIEVRRLKSVVDVLAAQVQESER